MQPLDSREVTFGEVQFVIDEPLPEDGHEVLETLRYGAMEVFDADVLAADENNLLGSPLIATAYTLLKLQPETVRVIRDILFRSVKFTRPNIQTARTLAGNINAAFSGLPHVRIHEMIVRCFVVGFSSSFNENDSRITSAISDFLQSPPETFTRSSPTPSTPDSSE